MAKNSVNQWSTTRALNLDVGGLGITTNDSGSNISPAFQEIMAQIAGVNAGTDPLNDTMKIRNATDTTKTFSMSAANIDTSTNLTIDANSVYRYGAPRETYYSASGTHTFALTTQFFQIEAVGGGGGGGGADGQGAGTRAAASGGSSGFYGRTAPIAKGLILTGAVVIGAAGTSGAATGGTGGNGGNTTWIDVDNSFTWGGGKGGLGIDGDGSSYATAAPPNPATSSGALIGFSDRNTAGFITGSSTATSGNPKTEGGIGGSTPFGSGGTGGEGSASSSSSGSAGSTGSGYGSGGGGATTRESTTNFAGGAGTGGYLIVREW